MQRSKLCMSPYPSELITAITKRFIILEHNLTPEIQGSIRVSMIIACNLYTQEGKDNTAWETEGKQKIDASLANN